MMLDADKRRYVLWYWVLGSLALLAFIALLLFYYSGSVDSQVKKEADPSPEGLSEIMHPAGANEENYLDSLNSRVSEALILIGDADGSLPPASGGDNATTKVINDYPVLAEAPSLEMEDEQKISRLSPVEGRSGFIVSENISVEQGPKKEIGDEEKEGDFERLEADTFSVSDNTLLQKVAQGEMSGSDEVGVSTSKVEVLSRFPLPQRVLSIDTSLALTVRKGVTVDTSANSNSRILLEKKPEMQNSLAVAIAAGVILGRSGADPFAMVQPRLGVDLEYRLGKKFALSTGAYFNEVCYRTSGENYTAKSDFWTDGIQPETVQGECNVLELPLSVNYYFNGSRENSFYVSAGAISYLMLREDYKYEYDASAPADVRKGWKERNNNQHFMGMAHFNFGFQKTVGKKSALKLESYVHLPLTGVGHGQVRLFSAGMTAKYLFDFRK